MCLIPLSLPAYMNSGRTRSDNYDFFSHYQVQLEGLTVGYESQSQRTEQIRVWVLGGVGGLVTLTLQLQHISFHLKGIQVCFFEEKNILMSRSVMKHSHSFWCKWEFNDTMANTCSIKDIVIVSFLYVTSKQSTLILNLFRALGMIKINSHAFFTYGIFNECREHVSVCCYSHTAPCWDDSGRISCRSMHESI